MARFVFTSANSISTSNVTSVTVTDPLANEVTFNFSTSVKVGWYLDGNGDADEPFVISDQDFTITSITPASSNSSGTWANGAMVDPFTTSSQGFDELLSTGSRTTPYSGNVDPGATGSAIAISTGDNKSIVKAVRLTTPDTIDVIKQYVTLHVVSEAPLLGSLPPDAVALGGSGTPKPTWNWNNVNLNVFRDLDYSGVTGLPAIADVIADIPPEFAVFGRTDGDAQRRFTLFQSYSAVSNGYSEDIVNLLTGPLALQAHNASATTSQRKKIAHIMLKRARRVKSILDRAGSVSALNFGAGQGGDRGPWLYYAAFLLGDSDLLAQARSMESQMVSSSFWGRARQTSAAAGGNGVNSQPVFDEMFDLPFANTDEGLTNLNGRYSANNATILFWEYLGVAALRNGPGGITGAAAVVNGAFDETNQRAAVKAFSDIWVTMDPSPSLEAPYQTAWPDLYNLIQPTTGISRWEGLPYQIPYVNNFAGSAVDNFFTAGGSSGQIAYDFSAYSGNYANPAATKTWFRYSIDGYQYVEVDLGLSYSGTRSGLTPGMLHYCGFALENSYGKGEYTSNYSFLSNGTDITGDVTATGAKSGAPTFTVDPVIVAKRKPIWPQTLGNWKPAASPSINDVEFACGAGYLTGNYALTDFTYQFKLDGVNEGSASATKTFLVNPATMSGKVLSCDVSVSNGNGSDSATATGVTLPSYYFYYVNNTLGSSSSVSSDSISIPIGTANANRWVVVVQTASRNAGVPNAASLNSVSMDLLGTVSGAGTRLHNVFMSSAKVASGTTATMDVTGTGTWFGNARYFSFVILSATKPTLEDISTLWRTGSGTSALDPLSVVDGGAVLLFADGDGNVGGNTITTDAPFAYINQYSGAGTDVWLAQGAHVTVTDTLNINATSAFGWIQGLGVSALSFSNIT